MIDINTTKNKFLLFFWFGDNKPKFADWNIENFKRLNPDYEIIFIEYSYDQLVNYKNQNDELLIESINKWKNCHLHDKVVNINNIVDVYRKLFYNKFIKIHNTESVIMCDLDCFPILSFTDFFEMKSYKYKVPNATNLYPNPVQLHYPFVDSFLSMSINNRKYRNVIVQIQKDINLSKDIANYEQIYMNEDAIDKFKNCRNKFENCELTISNCFCSNKFSPIEHYFIKSRIKINNSNTCDMSQILK